MHKEIMHAIELMLKGSDKVIFKEFLDVSEAAIFLGLTKNALYKLNHEKVIPIYKPRKKVYYKREDLLNYLSGVRIASSTEMEQQASEILKTLSDVR